MVVDPTGSMSSVLVQTRRGLGWFPSFLLLFVADPPGSRVRFVIRVVSFCHEFFVRLPSLIIVRNIRKSIEQFLRDSNLNFECTIFGRCVYLVGCLLLTLHWVLTGIASKVVVYTTTQQFGNFVLIILAINCSWFVCLIYSRLLFPTIWMV